MSEIETGAPPFPESQQKTEIERPTSFTEFMAATSIAVTNKLQENLINIAILYGDIKRNAKEITQRISRSQKYAKLAIATMVLAAASALPEPPTSNSDTINSNKITLENSDTHSRSLQFLDASKQIKERRENEREHELRQFGESAAAEQTENHIMTNIEIEAMSQELASQREVEKYGEFALGRTNSIDTQTIINLLKQCNAPYGDYQELAKKMKEYEQKYQIGAEYVLIIIAQETKCGNDIQTGKATKAGKNNWGNFGPRDNNGKFPDFGSPEEGIEKIFKQLHRYHRVWEDLNDPEKPPTHTYSDAMTINYAPIHLLENQRKGFNTETRVDEGERLIRQWREETEMRRLLHGQLLFH